MLKNYGTKRWGKTIVRSKDQLELDECSTAVPDGGDSRLDFLACLGNGKRA
jgi:hypothetical protein